jgi:ATP-dependent Clp protease ATP-binding subunit ClpB
MNIEKYTDRAKGFLQAAQTIAMRDGHQQFTPEHVLKALLDDSEGMAAGLIDRAAGQSRQAKQLVDAALAKLPKVSGAGASSLHLTPALARVFDTAEKAAEQGRRLASSRSSVCLLALAIEKDSEAGKILAKAGVTPQGLNAAIKAIRKGRTADSASAEQGYDALKKYARDLTAGRAKASSIR